MELLFKEKKYKDALEAYETEENQKNWDVFLHYLGKDKKFNEFFVDYCVPFSDSKSDVVLKDRVKDYYQNVSFCEEGCTYDGINYTSNSL